jgi:hypothetical protein
MAMLFRQEDAQHDAATDAMFASQKSMRSAALVFLLVLVALLLSGTLKIGLLTESYAKLTLPISGMDKLQGWLYGLVPFDPAKGEEGVSAQGAILIGLLGLIGLASWKGIENIFDGFNRWTWLSLGLVALTLLTAAVGMVPHAGGLDILFNGKFFGVLFALIILAWIIKKHLSEDEIRDFLWESWKFVKQIFPLLVAGVFAVGVIREVIRPEWIEALAGQNSLTGNLAGVIFGVFMYFPTLVEVPIAKMFLGLGMHRGPLLAYLMADPELSLQSILITASIIGRVKAWTYVGWVALFSTLAGLIYGSWVDGASLGLVLLYLLVFMAFLAGALWLVNRNNANKIMIAQ